MHRIQAYSTLAIIFIIGITILYLPVLINTKRKGQNVFRKFSYLGLFCAIFLIVFATILFVPITMQYKNHILNVIPFNWIIKEDIANYFLVEIIPNIMLFIPFGFFLPSVYQNKRKFLNTISVILIVTFSIEFIQYFIGRIFDINDIITNLLGGIIGYLVFVLSNKIFKNKKWWYSFLYKL